MNRNMAHRHPDFKDPCYIEEPQRSLSEWLLLIVCGIVVAGALWALLVAAFLALT